jgi:hypothetical protein
MPFNPSLPAPDSPIRSDELRNQFNALKGLIDALVPIGVAYPWFKSLAGVPALPANFVECNGQVLNDGESPLDGQVIPDLNNAQLFLRGATASGGTGGSTSHSHTVDLTGVSAGDPGSSGGTTVQNNIYPTSDVNHMPPYYEVVFVMRVK